MKNVVISVAVLVVILVAAFFMIKKPELMVENRPSPKVSIEAQPTETITVISMKEVAKHSTESDCWLVIEGNVYDVTGFIPKHPGEERILNGCGKDATELFATKGGTGLPHSQNAVNTRESLKIGILDTSI